MTLVVAMGALLGSVFSAIRLASVTEDTAAANRAARGILETMSAMPFEQAFAAYNADEADDPDPKVDYLTLLSIPKGLLAGENGEVVQATLAFPAVEGLGGLELREDFVDATLGMPSDLNGDGDIDGLDHSDDYRALPVSVRLEWRGKSGMQRLVLATVLGRG